jgi:hypothetical protein
MIWAGATRTAARISGCLWQKVRTGAGLLPWKRWLSGVIRRMPCDGVRPLNFVMFGYEITVFDKDKMVLTRQWIPSRPRALSPQSNGNWWLILHVTAI